MRRIIVIALALALAGCQYWNRATGATGDGMNQAITERYEQYREALLKKDVASLENIWADDLVFVNARGQVQNKSQRLEDIRSGATAFKSIDMADHVINPQGKNLAVATSRVTLDAQYGGKAGSGSYRVTIVWKRAGSQWRMSAIQMTRVQE